MGALYLYGWDPVNDAWVKINCDADGKLKIDPALIFENPPTEDEAKKGPSSEWAYDHKADAAAHHAKFTAAEARAAINNILNSLGKVTDNFDLNYKSINFVRTLFFDGLSGTGNYGYISYYNVSGRWRMWGVNSTGGAIACYIEIFNGATYDRVALQVWVTAAITTHKADVDAHHAKYTDAEALAACGLDGSQYYSIPGSAFEATAPDVHSVTKGITGVLNIGDDGFAVFAHVHLPHGATVTGVIVYGSEDCEDNYWYLKRVTLTSGAAAEMASNTINSEDVSISAAAINNSAYGYYIYTDGLTNGDVIYGAAIIYTI